MRKAIVLFVSAILLFAPSGRTEQTGIEALFQKFKDPPREYTVRPFWFWNGKLEVEEIERQIQEMASQGVYGAYVHNRTGLETPYLSEEYFKIVDAAFKKSSQLGFLLGFVDEYEWPSGEARDIWLKGPPSRVLAANPQFRMRSLGYIEREVNGPKRVEIDGIENFQFAVAARLVGQDAVDADSIADISANFSKGNLTWKAPAGRWLVMAFYLSASQGIDGGMVDLLNAAAIRKYLDLVYEEYYRRFGQYFGSTIDSTFSDHEGDYGYRLAWTPELFEAFKRVKGYDLRRYLPLLIYDGGKITPKVRCDYFDLISELYYRAFFKQVADWCHAHKIKITGHIWEESLHMEAAFEGDLPRMMRGWSWPGVDSLWERGRLPRDFKPAASVAHFRGVRFTCENQGLQGADSYLDFQKMRLGTNMIAAWGVSNFVPHAFNYHRRRIEFPPDWFYHQPYWKYFKNYADYARRLSFMNSDGRHVADILLFQPTESVWAHSDPVFSYKKWDYRFAYPTFRWGNPVDTIDSYYTEIMNRLAQERWDFDVADSYYLAEAKLKDRHILIGDESYRVLIMPPATTVRRATLAKIREFYDQGGIVIAIRMLPAESMDEGRDDPEIRRNIEHIFGSASPSASVRNANAKGGRSFFVKDDVSDLLKILQDNLRQDVKVTRGEGGHLFYQHRRKEGVDFYWLVNDSENARQNSILFSVLGIPERWDALTGEREPLFYRHTDQGTEVRLSFDPWDGYYVVFGPMSERQTADVVETNLESFVITGKGKAGIQVKATAPLTRDRIYFIELADGDKTYRGSIEAQPLEEIELKGSWTFTPEKSSLSAPYAQFKLDLNDQGERLGWHTREYKDLSWSKVWLSRERLTIRDWWVIGPFSNEDHRGFDEAYPPELGVNLDASYVGADGSQVRWVRYSSDSYYVDLERALNLRRDKSWITAYAFCYVYSPTQRRAQFRVAADNNAKLWINGRNILDLHIHPFYYEMREDFALIREAELQAGWNQILVKAEKGRGARIFGFMLRVTDAEGRNFEDLLYSLRKSEPAGSSAQASKQADRAMAWYRIQVPPGATAVKLPGFKGEFAVYLNGRKLALDGSGLIRFPQAAEGIGNVLAIKVGRDEVIADLPEFMLGRTRLELGSWTMLGLPYYSGSAAYEREFDLPAGYANRKLILDCGEVGVVAQVWVNGRPAGVRVWLPYAFDISGLVRPGRNHLKILVTNTMSNERAVENHADKLDRIKVNGLLGPVRIVPYLEAELNCAPISERGNGR